MPILWRVNELMDADTDQSWPIQNILKKKSWWRAEAKSWEEWTSVWTASFSKKSWSNQGPVPNPKGHPPYPPLSAVFWDSHFIRMCGIGSSALLGWLQTPQIYWVWGRLPLAPWRPCSSLSSSSTFHDERSYKDTHILTLSHICTHTNHRKIVCLFVYLTLFCSLVVCFSLCVLLQMQQLHPRLLPLSSFWPFYIPLPLSPVFLQPGSHPFSYTT